MGYDVDVGACTTILAVNISDDGDIRVRSTGKTYILRIRGMMPSL